MKVNMINWTPNAIQTMIWAFNNMMVGISPYKFPEVSENEKIDFLQLMAKTPHKGVLEYVNMTFYIDGSRAFQQQLTRSRDAVYSIQSLRMVNPGSFADFEGYHVSKAVVANRIVHEKFKEAMKTIQGLYAELIDLGAATEDARGILPLNINSPITFSINLRALMHMLELRFCLNTQEEYRLAAQLIKKEIADKIDADLADILFKPNCAQWGFCNSSNPCEKVTKYKIYKTMNQ